MATNSNPPLYFKCHLCGECCSSWSIPIEREKAEVLLTREWVQTRLKEANRALMPLSEEAKRLPLTDENVCVFLGEDKRCLIEVHEGPDLKPTDCKRFPFASVSLPDGTTRHDTSAVCKHISEKLLLAFQPILPKPDEAESLKQLFDQDGLEDLGTKVKLNLFRNAQWQELNEQWEARLKPVFSSPNISTEEALRQARTLIRNWQRELPPQPPPKTRIRLAQWMTVCFLRKPYGTLNWWQLISGTQYEDPRIFGLAVELKEVRKQQWNPAIDRHLNAFLYNILTRKRLLSRGASLESLLAMTTVTALLVRWYALALAAIRQEAVALDDITMAIRLVERYYTGHQPRFLSQFCNRWRGALLLAILL